VKKGRRKGGKEGRKEGRKEFLIILLATTRLEGWRNFTEYYSQSGGFQIGIKSRRLMTVRLAVNELH
jgi:hypothetical protein